MQSKRTHAGDPLAQERARAGDRRAQAFHASGPRHPLAGWLYDVQRSRMRIADAPMAVQVAYTTGRPLEEVAPC